MITTSIFGALYQLFPATMGVGARNVRLGHATFWMLQAGAVLLVGGFWFWHRWLQGFGWLALALAVGAFASNVVTQRRRATQSRMVGRYVSAGHASLGTAMLLGLARIGETAGWWHVDRLGIIASHFHLAALGFGTLTAVGIGSRMLPMFLAARGVPEWPLRWIGPVGGLGMATFTGGQLSGVTPLIWTGSLLMAGAILLHLHLAFGYFRARAHARLDPALAHLAVAFIALGMIVPAGLGLLVARGGFHPRGWAAYGLLGLLGWLVLLIVGIYYRILPSLTWLHLYGRRAGQPNTPTAADLIRRSWAWASLGCLTAGLLLLIPAVALGAPSGARAGAVLFALGVGLVLAQAVRALAIGDGVIAALSTPSRWRPKRP